MFAAVVMTQNGTKRRVDALALNEHTVFDPVARVPRGNAVGEPLRWHAPLRRADARAGA